MNHSFEDEILDHDFKEPNNFYSKRSFKVFLIILGLIIGRIIIVYTYGYSYTYPHAFQFVNSIIEIAIRILSIYGLYVALVSVTQREPISVIKIIGLIGNILAFANLILYLLIAF